MDTSEIATLVVATVLVAIALWGYVFATRMVKQSKELLDLVRELRRRTEDTLKQITEARTEKHQLELEAYQAEMDWIRTEKRTERAETLESAQIALMYMGLARKALALAQSQDLDVLNDVQRKEVQEQVVQAVHAAMNRIVNPLWILQDAHDDLVRGTPGIPDYRGV